MLGARTSARATLSCTAHAAGWASIITAVAGLSGCVAGDASPAWVGLASEDAVAIDLEVISQPPPQADGPSVMRATISDRRGGVRVAEDVVSAIEVGDGALVVTKDGTLTWVRVGSTDTTIAAGVVGEPAVAPDGETIAYVTGETDAMAVHVWRRGEARAISETLGAAGMLVFSPDGSEVAFVGARGGGVAGLFVADAMGARGATCLTNCALRAGVPFLDSFVRPPGAPGDVRFERDAIAWDAGEQSHRVALPPEHVR